MRSRLLLLPLLAMIPLLSGCGEQGIQIAKDNPDYAAAEIFTQRCSGCHTLKIAGTDGSAALIKEREYKDGPNFNQRNEEPGQVLYAIRNGGFSSGPMPQNIVTGKEAEQVAKFVAKYAGREAASAKGMSGGSTAPNPGNPGPAGAP